MESVMAGGESRELFEACRNGDIHKVTKLVNPNNVNSKDTAGRKSSPLHFAAGKIAIKCHYSQYGVFPYFPLTNNGN